ncbi:MAG TPA: RcnB family protein [Thermohalobaculum sp.]|nr:RcnB family protein [Thermohalobaculum sp.]
MTPIRMIAATALAVFGIALAAPALAGPGNDRGESASVEEALLAGGLHAERYRDRDWRHRRDGEHRHYRRHAGRYDDRDWRHGRDRGHKHYRRHDDRHDRGHHYGWKRGKHDGWRDDHRYGRVHLRSHHHPRHRYWVGRRAPRRDVIVVYNYEEYYLPRPRRGHYYARVDNDVFLVAEATRRIIDAFVLLDAAARY